MSEYEIRAVTTIQTHFRGYLARKQYSKMLLTFFEEEEEKRREKERIQMLEGEILLEKYQLRNRIAESITLNHNEERLTNMMATRIQRAWKKYQEGRVHAHPVELKGQDKNDDYKVLFTEEQFKASERNTTSIHKQSSSQQHLESSSPSSDDVELSNTPTIISPPNATPTNEFEVSRDPSYKEGLISKNSECPTSTEQELSNGKLNSISIHPVQHFGLENTFKSGTIHHMVQLSASVKSSDDKPLTINKEGIKSLDDRYRLCYTIELSGSSADEDKNWLAEPEDVNIPDTANAVEGNLAMEQFNNNAHYELDNFVSDDDPIHQHTMETSPNRQAGHGPKKWKVLDHSTSPLHSMTLQQLRQLFLSLEQRLSDHSRILIELLEEKDQLMNENELLKTNIAHLARRAQSLYQAS